MLCGQRSCSRQQRSGPRKTPAGSGEGISSAESWAPHTGYAYLVLGAQTWFSPQPSHKCPGWPQASHSPSVGFSQIQSLKRAPRCSVGQLQVPGRLPRSPCPRRCLPERYFGSRPKFTPKYNSEVINMCGMEWQTGRARPFLRHDAALSERQPAAKSSPNTPHTRRVLCLLRVQKSHHDFHHLSNRHSS